MAGAPSCAATGATVPVSVADGPWMIGNRLPMVVWMSVAMPMANREKLMNCAFSAADMPMAAATANGRMNGEMSTRVCCQPYSRLSYQVFGRSSMR